MDVRKSLILKTLSPKPSPQPSFLMLLVASFPGACLQGWSLLRKASKLRPQLLRGGLGFSGLGLKRALARISLEGGRANGGHQNFNGRQHPELKRFVICRRYSNCPRRTSLHAKSVSPGSYLQLWLCCRCQCVSGLGVQVEAEGLGLRMSCTADRFQCK